MSTATETQLY